MSNSDTIVTFLQPSDVRASVMREKIRIGNTRERRKDPRESILLYASVANEVANELALRRNTDDIDLIDKLIWLEAHAREWVE